MSSRACKRVGWVFLQKSLGNFRKTCFVLIYTTLHLKPSGKSGPGEWLESGGKISFSLVDLWTQQVCVVPSFIQINLSHCAKPCETLLDDSRWFIHISGAPPAQGLILTRIKNGYHLAAIVFQFYTVISYVTVWQILSCDLDWICLVCFIICHSSI